MQFVTSVLEIKDYNQHLFQSDGQPEWNLLFQKPRLHSSEIRACSSNRITKVI